MWPNMYLCLLPLRENICTEAQLSHWEWTSNNTSHKTDLKGRKIKQKSFSALISRGALQHHSVCCNYYLNIGYSNEARNMQLQCELKAIGIIWFCPWFTTRGKKCYFHQVTIATTSYIYSQIQCLPQNTYFNQFINFYLSYLYIRKRWEQRDQPRDRLTETPHALVQYPNAWNCLWIRLTPPSMRIDSKQKWGAHISQTRQFTPSARCPPFILILCWQENDIFGYNRCVPQR